MEYKMFFATSFTLCLFAALRTRYFVLDVALLHLLLSYALIHASFLSLSIQRINNTTAHAYAYAYLKGYRAYDTTVSCAYSVAHKIFALCMCSRRFAAWYREYLAAHVEAYRAWKRSVRNWLLPSATRRYHFRLYFDSALLIKDFVQYYAYDKDEVAQMLERVQSGVGGVARVVRGLTSNVAQDIAADAQILQHLKSCDSDSD